MIEFDTNFSGYDLDFLDDSITIDTIDEYSLLQQSQNRGFNYYVVDDIGIAIAKYFSLTDASKLSPQAYDKSQIRQVFVDVVSQHQDSVNTLDNFDLEDTDDFEIKQDNSTSANDSFASFYNKYYGKASKSTGFLDKLNKSDTLVIHCEDASTDMLSQLYAGKGWDVLRDGNIDPVELHKLLESHKNIVMLGHGTPSGLINKQGGGYVIGDLEGPILSRKNTFAIWCYASSYAKKYGIHGFWTGNVPSEVVEAKWIGADVSADWMLENITYWSKCCADVIDQALAGDVAGAVKQARTEYAKSKASAKTPDELKVINYNTESIQAL